MTEKQRKAIRVKNQLKYLKTEKGKASRVQRAAKLAKRLSHVQIRVLQALKEGGNVRVWHQPSGYPMGWHCQLRNSNNTVLKSSMHILTVELLQSENKQGMLLKIISKTENEIIYTISKKGLQVLKDL